MLKLTDTMELIKGAIIIMFIDIKKNMVIITKMIETLKRNRDYKIKPVGTCKKTKL